MRSFATLLSLLTVVGLVLAETTFSTFEQRSHLDSIHRRLASTISPYTVFEKRASVPHGWVQGHKVSLDRRIPLRFGLTQKNIDSIGQLLEDISHPESENYGAHWTPEKVAETFAPSDNTIETVRSWLTSNGIEPSRVKLSNTKGWIQLDASVEEAERLLKTEYHMYEHSATGKQHLACQEVHLPQHVVPHVEMITPTVHFNAILPRNGESSELSKRKPNNLGVPNEGVGPHTTGKVSTLKKDLSKCDKQTDLDCLRALYGIYNTPSQGKKNSYGIVEYTPQAYVASDMDKFFANYSSKLVGHRPKLVSIDGGVVQTHNKGFDYNGESNLDLQYGMGLVGPNQNVTLYQVGDEVEGASFNDFLDALDGTYCKYKGGDDPSQDGIYPDPSGGYQGPKACGTAKLSNVISTSYGYNEADLTAFYTKRQCDEYAKLGLMGVTVLYSSGDYGVAGNSGVCLNPDGSQTANGKRFNPSFPGTCPYITSVGATQIDPGKTVKDPEGACQQVIFSGGGFSNYFPVPGYQKKAIASYYQKYAPKYTAAQYNNSRAVRGFPDLSANGANYVVAVNNAFYLIYGTSASAPVVGAMLTLVNDARIAVGKKPIGFINPTIYSSSFTDAFNDIKHGGNQGCGTPGFTAVPGWDPVTGLGTPNLQKLVSKWLQLK